MRRTTFKDSDNGEVKRRVRCTTFKDSDKGLPKRKKSILGAPGREKEYPGRAMFCLLGQSILTEEREHIFLEYELEFGTRELSMAGEGI